MEQVLGIVAEYNPFHNGHLYHLEQSKKVTGAKYAVAVISGNFMQRGEPSLIDKWAKAEMAIANGVDLVIELPALYAISSAENFAEGAIKILNSLKVVDFISFGAEAENIEILEEFAEILYKEPKEYKLLLRQELDKGISYPKARQNALTMYLGDIKKYDDVLSRPNNILAIEYLKALRKTKSHITPIAVRRIEADYHDLNAEGEIISATAIRSNMMSHKIEKIKNAMPQASYEILEKKLRKGQIVKSLMEYEKEIIYTLRQMDIEEIAELPDVEEGLENAIKKAANSCNTVSELINMVCSKRYTKTRIQRILLYVILEFQKNDIVMSKKMKQPYVRVLGFNTKGKYLLSQIAKANSKINFVVSVKKFMDENTNKNYQEMIERDIWATNVYTLGYEKNSKSNLDFTKKVISSKKCDI
jgi:predicted nucleotidyltransferase